VSSAAEARRAKRRAAAAEAASREARRPRPRDPRARYGLDLAAVRAQCGVLRRLMRDGAQFTASWSFGDNSAEAEHAEGRGPPSLCRSAYLAACRAASPAQTLELASQAEFQEHGARLGVGPLVINEWLGWLIQRDAEGTVAVDRDNVTLSTIHAAKGLEWRVRQQPKSSCPRSGLGGGSLTLLPAIRSEPA
jgi:hypothetical protein